MAMQIGDLVDGKYKILERLGAGGMGEVYKAEHVFLRTTRVVKVIRPQISESADAHERFLREAQLATKVQHPNVATVHDFSALPDGSHYMVWEYIEGENLAQVLRRRGVLPPPEAIRLTVQALAGLEAIHRAGIIHRDISPENMMITRDGNVKIIDLGVAKAEQGDQAMTQTGMFVGKLRYSSPEQLGFLQPGEKIDSRADLYSLGVVLFEMLAGRPPFEATSPHQYFIQHAGGTNVQPIDLTQVPSQMRPVVTRALERDRNKRFANARDFAAALDSIPATSTLAETIRTPLPTVRTATPTEIIPKGRSRDMQNAIIIIGIVVVLAIGVVATWFYRSRGASEGSTPLSVAEKTTPHPAAATAVQPQPQPQPPTQTTVEVAPPVSQPQPVQPQPQPVAATPVAPAAAPPRPRQPETKTAEAGPAESKPTAKAPELVVPSENDVLPSFVEGGVSTRNEEAIRVTRERLRGVSRVRLDARGDADLVKQLQDTLGNLHLTIADDADVTIRFSGTVKHLRFGRKERSASATILRRGHPIFSYEMKPEEYRVGDTPVEAFARVLSDVFGR